MTENSGRYEWEKEPVKELTEEQEEMIYSIILEHPEYFILFENILGEERYREVIKHHFERLANK